jgi:hypothetical protein
VTHALVDLDEQVRTRAQELIEQALMTQAAAFAVSSFPVGGEER